MIIDGLFTKSAQWSFSDTNVDLQLTAAFIWIFSCLSNFSYFNGICLECLFASVKSRLVLPLWYWLTWVVPDKGPLNGVCVRVCVCLCVLCVGGRKDIRPVKNWVVGAGMVICLVQTCIQPSWCHCHSLSLASVKSRLVLPFWYRLTRVVPDKRPAVCVCVCVC